jgi:hypothetical protein
MTPSRPFLPVLSTMLAAILVPFELAACNEPHAEVPPSAHHVTRVALHVDGDRKLAHRFATHISLDLDDAGMTEAAADEEADFIVDGHVERIAEKSTVSLGEVSLDFPAQVPVTTMSRCASMTDSETPGELFQNNAEMVAEDVRQQFPKAQSVAIDDGSDFAASSIFRGAFMTALSNQRFTVAKSGPADVSARVRLAIDKVPIESTVAKYSYKVSNASGDEITTSDSSERLSARVIGTAPGACPNNFRDMNWLVGNDRLNVAAHSIVTAIQK